MVIDVTVPVKNNRQLDHTRNGVNVAQKRSILFSTPFLVWSKYKDGFLISDQYRFSVFVTKSYLAYKPKLHFKTPLLAGGVLSKTFY